MPTVKAECESCNGTGVYTGFGEGKGCGVVCSSCEGSGAYPMQYREFVRRKKKSGVKWIYETNPGIGVGGPHPEQFGGMSFDDWLAGKKFVEGMENRKCTCPAWWYQSADYKRKPEWDECSGMGSFSACSSFPKKDKCWARWDKEFGR